MTINQISEFILKKSNLKEDDYFDTTIFYYLAGRFPDLTIKECMEVVDLLRQNFIH